MNVADAKVKDWSKMLESKNKFENLAIFLALLFSLYTLFEMYSLHSSGGFWRHDSIYYEPDFVYKLRTEGRWINYIFFEFLRLINPYVAVVSQVLCLLYFTYFTAYKFCSDKVYSLLVASLLVQIPTFPQTLLWPVYALLACFTLISSILLYRRLNKVAFFLLYAILFFGTINFDEVFQAASLP